MSADPPARRASGQPAEGRLREPMPGRDSATVHTPFIGFGIAWAVFWILLTTVEVQDYLRDGGTALWKPLVWEGSSLLVASAIVWAQWRTLGRADHLLGAPWRWFAASLRWLPLAAPLFVVAVYALRHGAYALIGQRYVHDAWDSVFRYEISKFAIFYLLFAAVIFAIRSHGALSNAQIRLAHEAELAREAQLLQLTQQIEPHFLFNALNTIAATVHVDPELADRLLTRLAALMRAATDLSRRAETPLDDELRLLEAYGEIMVQRFGERVSLQWDVDAAARPCLVPSLCLQPLLENAFRHVVERRSQRTTIVVRARRTPQRLSLEVADDGGVLPAAPVFGVGLSNLRQRLLARHGGRASVRLEARNGGGVCARIELPCEC